MKIPLVMGIINVTPDSFSGDGLLPGSSYIAPALTQAEQMLADGADMLDIGGESSRPGAESVSAEEEINRVIPVIFALKKKFSDIPLAVDTVKAEVAERALQVGVSIVNDISALAHDARMASVVARYGSAVVLMDNRAKRDSIIHDAKIGKQYIAPKYDDVLADVLRELQMRVDIALKAGIPRDRIILDPGIGFGKTPEQNLALVAQVGKLKALGFPVLVGPSRKSFIGQILDCSVDERLEGTAACIAVSVFTGADIVRVHDVKFMARVVKMAAALRDAQAL